MLATDRGRTEGFYKAELLPTDDPRRMSGLLDLDDPRNPVRNWSIVFVPYCTGDVHSVHGVTPAPLVPVSSLSYGRLSLGSAEMPMLRGANGGLRTITSPIPSAATDCASCME